MLPKAAFSKKYLELDSTYRNRNQYPNPADFVVPYQISGSYNDCVQAFDPVCLSAPSETGSGATLVTAQTATLVPLVSSSVDNFYVNQFLGIIRLAPRAVQYAQIVAYSGATRTATVSGAYTLPPGAYDYIIRPSLPSDVPINTNTRTTAVLPLTAVVAFTPTTVTLQPSSSTTANFYYGMMIRLTSTATGRSEYRKVIAYDETTKQVTVSSPFSVIYTPADYYELLPFSYDNLRPLKYQGTSNMNQPVCYSVRLVHVAIPFVVRSYTDAGGAEFDERAILDVGRGGTIDQYPFFYVCLYSDIHKDNIQSLISNNPNSNNAVFRVPISSGDTPGPKKIMSQTTFTRCDMCPVIKFLPNDTFHLAVLLPNGEPLSFRQKDSISPSPPNEKLQISAVFELVRME